MNWESNIKNFVRLASFYQVRMILVGGGAVNFHGYQRHSADVDFWIETTDENLAKLLKVFTEMGYVIEELPEAVSKQQQNISVKFSPIEMELELITNFSINKPFEVAFKEAEIVKLEGEEIIRWRVLAYEDLILSKIKANRPKDLLDIQQLKKVNNY